MYALQASPEVDAIDVIREQVYGFLAAVLSHPDAGNWGCALRALEQRRFISAVDSVRERALQMGYPTLCDELPPQELDARLLVLELCQPLDHLREEYERVFCVRRIEPACSPYELNHRDGADGVSLAESLADLAGIYRATGFAETFPMPPRPDHIAYELGLMAWLIGKTRLSARMAVLVDDAAAEAAFCDLAQRNFFGNHLSDWVASFATGLQKYTGGGYLEALGRFLAAWVPFERHHLGLDPGLQEDGFAVGQRMSVAG